MELGSRAIVEAVGADGLTEQQRRFVEAMVAGATPEEAKGIAGYADSTPTVGILRGKLVENAISSLCDSRMRGDLKLKALKTVEELMGSKSAQVALGAARVVLEWDKGSDQDDDKPLSELGIDELEAMATRLEAERVARMKDVTPKNRA